MTTSTTRIRTAGDLSGLKIRTQVDSAQMDMLRSLGAVPVVIGLQYLRKAMEHRQVEGQEGMLQVVDFARLNEFQQHASMTRHVWDGFWICVNTAAWKKLPERLQRIVANTFNGTAPRQREENAKTETALRASLEKRGMTFTDIDPASFQDTLRRAGYYDRMKVKFGEQTWNVVQKATGLAA